MILDVLKNKHFINGLRLFISLYFVYFVIKKIDISTEDLRNQSLMGLLIGTFLVLMSFVVATIRWRNICLSIGININLYLATKICLLGAFFNQILPTSFGGDVIRFNELRAHASAKLVAFSIALDRGFTLIVILMHICNIYIFNKFQISGIYLTIFVILEILLLYLMIKLVGEKILKINIQFFVFLISIFLSYISLLFLLMAFTSLLGYEAFDYWIVLYHFPVSLILASLPISIGGWGLREAYLASFSPSIYFTNLIVLSSILFGVINIFIALPGMVIYLLKIKK